MTHDSLGDLKRRIAERLGYHAEERRPRGSLKHFVEILSPEGRAVGSAAGVEGESGDIQDIIDLAWHDALSRLPNWTRSIEIALTLADSESEYTLRRVSPTRFEVGYRYLFCEADSLAEAFCLAWFAATE